MILDGEKGELSERSLTDMSRTSISPSIYQDRGWVSGRRPSPGTFRVQAVLLLPNEDAV